MNRTNNFSQVYILGKLNSPDNEEVDRITRFINNSLPSLSMAYSCEIKRIYHEKSIDRDTLIICIGGDGTMLHGAQLALPTKAKVIGINVGKLGFLCELDPSDLGTTLEQILFNVDLKQLVQKRCALSVHLSTDPTDKHTAINEIHITNDIRTSIRYSVACNGNTIIRDQLADGLLICTPIGSTAYSLSVGGAIMDHNTSAIQIIPVAPHSLTSRPVILSNSSEVVVTISPQQGEAVLQVICDGHRPTHQRTGSDHTHIHISGKEKVKFAVLDPQRDIFTTLSQKMNWNGIMYNKQ